MPLMRGSLVHIALAHHFVRMRAIQQHEDPNRYYTPRDAMNVLAPKLGLLAVELLPVAQATVEEYLALYADEGWHILYVEEEFRTELRDASGRTTLFTMRPDLIVEDRSGRSWICDHKIVSRLDSKISPRYTLSGQFLALQTLGQVLFGTAFGGCIVNAIQAAPGMRVKKYPVEPAPASLQRFPRLILDVADAIARLDAEERDPMDWPGAQHELMCMTAYGPCPFFEFCRWGME